MASGGPKRICHCLRHIGIRQHVARAGDIGGRCLCKDTQRLPTRMNGGGSGLVHDQNLSIIGMWRRFGNDRGNIAGTCPICQQTQRAGPRRGSVTFWLVTAPTLASA